MTTNNGNFVAILSALAFLICLGLVMVFSTSAILADANYGDSFFFLKRQLFFVLAGLVALYAGLCVRTDFYKDYAIPILALGLILLVLVLIPGLSKSAGGASRWIPLGPINLQPGEVFKLVLVVFLAASLADKRREIYALKGGLLSQLFFPCVAMGLLLLEPDFGTAFIVGAISYTLLFLGGARIVYLLGMVILAIPFAVNAIASSPYRLSRIVAFFDPWAHRYDTGYQIVESLISFGSGRVFGLGIGEGTGKLFFLPASHTDFILSAIGEELGFVGVILVVFCFAVIGVCGIRIALAAKNRHQTLLAAGITSLLILQALINFFVVLGLAPTKGVTLPFLSYGGSSLLTCTLMIGILLRINFETLDRK